MSHRIPLLLLAAAALAGLARPAAAQLLPAFGEDRAGTSGYQFLVIPVDARSAALGETVVASAADASALFWNPALAAQAAPDRGDLVLGASHARYHADIALNYGAGLYNLGPVVLGASLQTLDAGEMKVTTETQPFGTGQTFGYTNLAAGVSVSQALTDLFSYGVTAKYVRESTFGVTSGTAALDLGVFYRVGATGAQIGVAIRNFGLDGTPEGEVEQTLADGSVTTRSDFERIVPPTTFLLGVAYRPFRASAQHDLLLSGQLTNPSDNAERLTFGAEYTWSQLFVVRAGYQFGREDGRLPSLGFGLLVPGLGATRLRADYGFSHHGVLGEVHRLGLNLAL